MGEEAASSGLAGLGPGALHSSTHCTPGHVPSGWRSTHVHVFRAHPSEPQFCPLCNGTTSAAAPGGVTESGQAEH